MSRGQQGQVFNQTSGESTQAFGNAENAYNLAQGDVGNYQAQLSKYAAENPYQAGGEFQNAQNEVLANTSDAAARAAGTRLQTQAQRTGQNPAGATAATESMEQAGARNLSAEQSAANTERLGSEAGYNKGVLQGYGEVPGMEEGIAKGYSGLYGTALGEEESAAKQPSFLDELGNSLLQGGEQVGAAWASPHK